MMHVQAEEAKKRQAEEERKAAEKQRQVEILAEEARKRAEQIKAAEEEANKVLAKLQEKQRIENLLEQVFKEVTGALKGTASLEAIFKENPEIKAQFLTTKPLERSLAEANLDAVKFLVSMDETYPGWKDILEPGTPVYEFMASKFKNGNTSENNQASPKFKP